MAKKLEGWKNRFFTEGGREVLLKAVIQAIPTYAMSFFKIPNSILKEIESMYANFWWGSKDKGKKIHWKAWSFLQKSKAEGGLGFETFPILIRLFWLIKFGELWIILIRWWQRSSKLDIINTLTFWKLPSEITPLTSGVPLCVARRHYVESW